MLRTGSASLDMLLCFAAMATVAVSFLSLVQANQMCEDSSSVLKGLIARNPELRTGKAHWRKSSRFVSLAKRMASAKVGHQVPHPMRKHACPELSYAAAADAKACDDCVVSTVSSTISPGSPVGGCAWGDDDKNVREEAEGLGERVTGS